MDKRKAKIRGIVAAFCVIAAAFGVRAIKNSIINGKTPKNEVSVSIADSYTRYEDEGRKTVLVVKYEVFNGTDSPTPYSPTFKDYALQGDVQCERTLTGTGLPTERAGSLKQVEPGETMSFYVEYQVSSKKGNVQLCIDKPFHQGAEREYLRMTLDPNTGKEI
ncbi:MAG: DUF5067 domain-containing protein [Oscillospiraceae bacterium]|nr:DUF5067 domain-containing protein [Oscillospiraceae bacterium]